MAVVQLVTVKHRIVQCLMLMDDNLGRYRHYADVGDICDTGSLNQAHQSVANAILL